MDQPPQDQNSGAGNPDPSKNSLDLGNILLPKKAGPSVDSAQRVDAGTLLNQEQSATLVKPSQDRPIGSGEPRPGLASASATFPAAQEGIAPLQTYQGDIASSIQDKGVSVISIAAAEATRRGTQPVSQDAEIGNNPAPHTGRNILFSVIGLLLIVGAGGALVYALLVNSPLPQQQTGVAPFIAIDGTDKVSVPADIDSRAFAQQLTAAKNSVSLSLGLVAQLYIEQDATTTGVAPTYMSAQTLLALLAPNIPNTLLRDITPVYLLGVHSFSVNQPFLILKVDSYEQAYAGMLAWEPTMKQDLSPLFAYTPTAKVGTQQNQTEPAQASSTFVGSSTSTSTATSTPIATSTPQTPPVQTGFTDAIVENHDARVIEDQYGTIDFLWTFLDRQTLVITTNPDTLHEIITRLTQTPITLPATAQ